MKPVIGLTAGTDPSGTGPLRYRLNRAYIAAVSDAGGIPIVLMPGGDSVALLDRLDGLILTGGADVDPELYGQEAIPESKIDRARDNLELPLIRAAMERGVPMFGVCRGIQVINVALGGSLIQHLPSHPRTDPNGDRQLLAHAMIVASESDLATLIAEPRVGVNSFHHQSVDELAPGLRAVGWSEDGVIEALESTDGSVIAVQCHPEELERRHSWARRLFESFVERTSS